jgi:hypothetical protein
VNRGSRPEDAQATQKISRAQLDEALKRTKSGTRRAVRSDPTLPAPEEVDFLGPRDDTAPLLGHIDPSSLSPIPAAANVEEADAVPRPKPARTPESVALSKLAELAEAEASAEPLAFVVTDEAKRPDRDTILRLRPRTAFVLGVAVAALVMLAGLFGYFAGRSPIP